MHSSKASEESPGGGGVIDEHDKHTIIDCHYCLAQHYKKQADKHREALKGLGSNYPDGELCFCEMRIGHPSVKDHSKACKKAREVLNK
jgi:hypothetical protein